MSWGIDVETANGSAEGPRSIPWLWCVGVTAVAALARVLVALTTTPFAASDTVGFTDLARMIGSMGFSGYTGLRTPPYPLFLLAVGSDPHPVRVAQMALGVAITAVLFVTTYRLSESTPTAVACALLYGLNLPQIYYESAVLSETLATFLIVCAVALLARLTGPEQNCSPLVVTGMALCAGVAALTRPPVSYTHLTLPTIYSV